MPEIQTAEPSGIEGALAPRPGATVTNAVGKEPRLGANEWRPARPGLHDAASVKRRAEFQKILINDHARRNTSEAARKSSKLTRPLCKLVFFFTCDYLSQRVTGFFEGLMLYLTRAEFENAASVLGIEPATLRQWHHRRAIPAAAKLRLVYFFGQPFEITESSLETRSFKWPAGPTCLADLAARYITHVSTHQKDSTG